MKEKTKETEKDLEFYLSKRYCQPEWAFFPQVRSSTGSADRVADGIAMNMYHSRKYEIHGFEIKISRTNWLNELKSPQKADEIFQYCDKWWLIVSNKDIVQNGELPKGWGLMIVRDKGLVIKVQATYNKVKVIDLGFIASLLRSASNNLVPRNSINQQIDDAWERGKKSQKYKIEFAERDAKRYKEIIETFEKEAGVKIQNWYNKDAEKVGQLLRRILNGEKFEQTLSWQIKSIENATKHILEEVEKLKVEKKSKK